MTPEKLPDHSSDRLPPARENYPLLWLSAVILGLLAVVFYVQINLRIRHGHSGDFRHFYYAAVALLDRGDLYSSGTGGYLYPPLIAFLYTPVARLSFVTAQRVMFAVNLLLMAGGVGLVSREFQRRLDAPPSTTAWVLTALLGVLLNVDKMHLELQMFQTNALMFACFAASLYWLDRSPILAGIPLGLIFNIKYLSVAMLPWLLVRRRYATAGSFVVSILGFALLPAVVSGWHKNWADLSVAYGGLLHMVGAKASRAQQANVEDIKNLLSCSITSASARLTRHGLSMPVAMALSVLAAGGCAALASALYAYRRLPVLFWPPAGRQRSQPFRAVLGLEFSAVVAATLCFSPQTNTRHLSMMLLLSIPAATLILFPRPGVSRSPVVLGAVIFFLGLIFPPGDRFSGFHHIGDLWFGIGGQCWCLLVCLFTVLFVGLLQAKATDVNLT